MEKYIICIELRQSEDCDTVPVAFVLVNTEVGKIDEVLESLKTISEVNEAYSVYGVYDIVTKVKADSMNDLKQVVTGRIRQLDDVMSTLTMIVMES